MACWATNEHGDRLRWRGQFIRHAARSSPGQSLILRGFYGYGDQRSFALSVLRSGGGAAALAASMAAKAGDGSLLLPPAPKCRGTTYLRNVLGQRLLFDGEASLGNAVAGVGRGRRGGACPPLGIVVRSRSRFDGCYHSSLYRGLWAYQETRLRQIALDAC